MDFLRDVAALLSEENKSLGWIAPTGFPWHSRYHKLEKKRTEVTVGGKRHVCTRVTGERPEVRVDKATRSAAPNVIHGLDAAHMHLVASRSEAARIPFVGVHDCFGFRAGDPPRGARW